MNMSNFLNDKRTLDAADEGNPGGDDAAAAAAVALPAGPDLSFIPESYHVEGKPDLAAFKAGYDELVSFKAQRDEAVAGIPESADGYEMTIPETIDFGDLELPEGFKFELSDDPAVAPLLGEMRSMLHKHSLPKEAAGEFLGLMAKYQAIETAKGLAAYKAGRAELGASAQSRIDNVSRLLDAKLPANLSTALKGAATSADGVKALEKLLSPVGLQAPASQPSGVDTEKMTPTQRLEYANQQSFANNQGRIKRP